jgi:8-oxo-dGTP pyrophosphatase MutT (NUDIX family)
MDAGNFLKQFSRTLELGLPGEDSHQLLMPTSRPLSSTAKEQSSGYRESAVGIVLHPTNTSIECILIQRPPYDGVHGGQISFPGGKRDLEDPSLEFTARRECFEEISLPIGHGELIHPMTEVFIPVSSFLVQPYIFYVDELPSLIGDMREVQEIISFDIFSLLNDDLLMRKSIRLGNGITLKDMPYFDIHNQVVWGATAMILSELKTLLQRMGVGNA